MSAQSCIAGQCGYLQQCVNQTIKFRIGLYCEHYPIFPITPYTGFVDSLIPIFIGMAMSAGNGGGILKGPFLEILLNYSQSEATAIAYCFMFGGCIINAILLLFVLNPKNPKRPIIHFNAGMILNLAISLASNIGSSLAAYLSELAIICIQQVFLFVLFPIVLKKAMALKKQEELQNQKDDDEKSSISENILSEEILPTEEKSQADQDLYLKFEKQQNQRFPIYQLFMIFLPFAICQVEFASFRYKVFVQLRSQRQRKHKDILIPCIIMDKLLFPCLMLCDILLWVFVYMKGKREELQKDQCNFEPEDRKFTPFLKFFGIFIAGFFSSLMSGLIGFGAVIRIILTKQGLIILPTLLVIGLPTRVASATSGYIYLWLSLNNLITLISQKLLPLNEILYYTFLAILGGSLVTKIVSYLVVKFRIVYIVVFIIVFLDFLNFLTGFLYIYLQIHRFGEASLTIPGNGC